MGTPGHTLCYYDRRSSPTIKAYIRLPLFQEIVAAVQKPIGLYSIV